MIDKIIITDFKRAEKYSFSDKRSWNVWITTVDASDRKLVERMTNNFNKKGVRHFVQYFYDWSEEDSAVWAHLESGAVKPDQVKRIIDFLKPICEDDKEHNLGINCHAGISRSTAIGIIALVMSGKTIEQALEHIVSIRPEAWPNLRVLRLASELLNHDLFNPVKEWKYKQQTSDEFWTPPDRLQPQEL